MFKRFPVTTLSLLILNIFWVLVLFYKNLQAFLFEGNTYFGGFDYVTIFPGCLVAFLMLVFTSWFRKRRPLQTIYVELTIPVVLIAAVMTTSLVNKESQIGVTLLDFSSTTNVIISVISLFGLAVPQALLLAYPTFVIWFIWLLNVADSLYALVSYQSRET